MAISSLLIRVSRYIALVAGVLASLVAIGGFPLGISLRVGEVLAVACFAAGVALTCYLWWIWAREPVLFNGINPIVLVSASGTAGLALYSNLVYGLWKIGLPMSIGTVAAGRMEEHYWLGPATLAYAVFCYLLMKWIIIRESK